MQLTAGKVAELHALLGAGAAQTTLIHLGGGVKGLGFVREPLNCSPSSVPVRLRPPLYTWGVGVKEERQGLSQEWQGRSDSRPFGPSGNKIAQQRQIGGANRTAQNPPTPAHQVPYPTSVTARHPKP